jgi:hypothetical protein
MVIHTTLKCLNTFGVKHSPIKNNLIFHPFDPEFRLNTPAETHPGAQSQEKQSPFHQNGEQWLHFKDL